ncbi:hypothetical protein ES703_90803 [subsurface metagenome]
MQNKANFRKSQMNVSSVITMNYEQLTMNYANKNKPNSNPIQSQSKPIKANQTQYKPNSRKAKMKLNFYSTKDYENKPRFPTPLKQTQSNPIFTLPILTTLVRRPVRRLVRRSFSEVGSFSEDGSLGEGGCAFDSKTCAFGAKNLEKLTSGQLTK